MTFTPADWTALLPGAIVAAAGLLTVGLELFLPQLKFLKRIPHAVISLFGLGLAGHGLLSRLTSGAAAAEGFHGTLVLDSFSTVLSLAILAAAALFVTASASDAERRSVGYGEYYALAMLATASMMFLVESTDFALLFLTLETTSIALYVLTGITRRNPRSNEASIKYLVTGGFATGFLLLGMTFLYGATGSIQLAAIGQAMAGSSSPLLTIGMGLLLVGLAFKVGAVPFHAWVADVYEGAPTAVTAFMSVAVKTAGFGVLIRILLTAAQSRPDLWSDILWILAVATMTIGNLLALRQNSVKRMLAYSSVAHTGYGLVGLAALVSPGKTFSAAGASATMFYLVTYTFMTLGAFIFLAYLSHAVKKSNGQTEWQDSESLDDLAGLGRRRPWAAAAMTLFMVSLGGLPPTAGFFGKFYLLQAAVAQGHVILAVIAVLASLVSMYYYLRVVVSMYMREPAATDEIADQTLGYVVAASAVATLGLGLQPGTVLSFAERSIQLLH
jgi:NADH-quinone oxidoreductase subunit N